jgi:hypothetical protein
MSPSISLWELVVLIIAAVVIVLPMWRICKKAGYPGWLGVLTVIPLLNLGLLYFLAFATWPGARSRS